MNHIPVEKEKKARRIAMLLTKYMRKKLTRDERDELDEWVGSNPKNIPLFKELTNRRKIKKALKILNS